MARKKKIKEEYTRAGIADNLIRIARKYGTTVEELRPLNPDIKINSYLKFRQKVRII